MNLPDTIRTLEELRRYYLCLLEATPTFNEESKWYSESVATIEAAITHLRSQEETIRECAAIALREFESADHGCRISDAILKLMEKKP